MTTARQAARLAAAAVLIAAVVGLVTPAPASRADAAPSARKRERKRPNHRASCASVRVTGTRFGSRVQRTLQTRAGRPRRCGAVSAMSRYEGGHDPSESSRLMSAAGRSRREHSAAHPAISQAGSRRSRLAVRLAAAALGLLASPALAAAALVVATEAPKRATLESKIVIVGDDGRSKRTLVPGGGAFLSRTASISPDGATFAVTVFDARTSKYSVELRSIGTGALVHAPAVGCQEVHWAPDSAKLSCVDADDTGDHLRLIDAASGVVTTLASGFFDRQVSFSPDSEHLAYVEKQESSTVRVAGALKRIELATQAITTVRPGNWTAPVWGPIAIAFSNVISGPRSDIVRNIGVVQPDGTGFRQITRLRPTVELFGFRPVAWSADGTRLLGGGVGSDGWYFSEAYAIDVVRGGARWIAPGVTPSGLSPDGRYVIGHVYSSDRMLRYGIQVVRVPWGGGPKRVLLNHAFSPSLGG
jgi:hypothetical protein